MESNIYLHPLDRDLQEFILAAFAVEIFMILFYLECKVYDLSTAAFFCYCLGLMARGKLLPYMALFAVANINRETTFLLIAVFLIYYLGRMPLIRYLGLFAIQAALFVVIRLTSMTIYADNPGVDMLVRPIQNLAVFANSPAGCLLHWLGFTIVILVCLKNWRSSARILQVSFLVLAPALTIMYLILGYSFEIRVYAEIYAVVWIMTFKNL